MFLVPYLVFALLCGWIEGVTIRADDPFELSLIHFNDFHARFEQTSTSSTKCKDDQPCIGGLARLYTAIHDLKVRRPDSVVLNAGDSFQGTLWYNLLRWNATQYFMNKLPLDAHTLGNHEFDHGISGVVPYLKSLKAPMLVSNIDDSLEPTIQNLYQDSLVIERNGRKIGIIGVILKTTNLIASTEQLRFTDEIEAVTRISNKMAAEGVNIIIVLSHCGVDVDMAIAAGAGKNIDIIVGGHSHTLLYPVGEKPPSNETALGDYPIKIVQSSGNKVLVVQASAYTKYLGDLLIQFDSNGNIVSWSGKPIFLDASIKEDEGILEEMEPFKEIVDAMGHRELGFSKVLLDKKTCYRECNIGNFLADAFVDYLVDEAEPGFWTYASVCIINQGGIRTSIEAGPITYEDLVIAQPFANTLQTFNIKGKHVIEALEHAAGDSLTLGLFMGQFMVQVSGLKVVFNVTNPVGERVVSTKIRCAKCTVPSYSDLNPETMYRLATLNFLGDGGDGFQMLSQNRVNLKVWAVDVDILERYIAKESPIITGLEGRITIVT